MVHGILQFTPSIAFRYVLHRCESRDIRCRESFVFTEEARVPPTHAADGARGAGCRFEHSLALSAPGFVGRPPRAPGRARRGRGGGARAECRSTPPARAPRLLNAFAGSFCCAGFDNDPSAGSPTETLLRLLLPLNDKVQWTSRDVAGSEPPTSPRSEHFTGSFNRQIAPPTKNGHAPPPIESRKSSQSVNPYYVWTCYPEGNFGGNQLLDSSICLSAYTQVRRTICTSVSLRASTRVSSGFALLRHSSPSFGSRQVCSHTNPAQKIKVGRRCTPRGDPTNQLPCALRVYSPVDSHTCQTPWSVFQDGSNGEPTGQRPERADAEARRRRALPATIEETAFHERIESPGFGRPPIHAGPCPGSISVPAHCRSTSDRGASPAPIRFPPDNFKQSLTIFSKSFSSFPRGQQRARGAWEASIRPATIARPVIEARGEEATRCMTPRQTCPRPNGFGRNLRLKTRWFTGFCNSHQVSHFATFFIDARAEISVAESRFRLQKKHRFTYGNLVTTSPSSK
ncbi:hypothetical protein CQW23_34528 [Capsicum baccatum]|uniref:Protein TAR1 n=1 Tax=Capsicum baccatum TaxID=33114 RepID=A0A2G2UYN8_CAPBA|nr:hypothetical protein CQW23_34528 [Capsicum baccatum]